MYVFHVYNTLQSKQVVGEFLTQRFVYQHVNAKTCAQQSTVSLFTSQQYEVWLVCRQELQTLKRWESCDAVRVWEDLYISGTKQWTVGHRSWSSIHVLINKPLCEKFTNHLF